MGVNALTALIAAYASDGQVKRALALFKEAMRERKCKPDAAMINAVAKLYRQQGLSAIHLLDIAYGALTSYAYSTILMTCTELSEVKKAHEHLLRGKHLSSSIDDVLGAALVTSYANKPGGFAQAKATFEELLSKDNNNLGVSTWNAMMAACCAQQPQAYTDHALRLFDDMLHRYKVKPDAISLTIAATAARNHHEWSAMRILQIADKGGVTPSPQLYSLLLAMCSDRRRATEGKLVHAHILNNNNHHHHNTNNTNDNNKNSGNTGNDYNNTAPVEIDDILACGLITMYAKCACQTEAIAVFNETRKRRLKDGSRVLGVASWND